MIIKRWLSTLNYIRKSVRYNSYICAQIKVPLWSMRVCWPILKGPENLARHRNEESSLFGSGCSSDGWPHLLRSYSLACSRVRPGASYFLEASCFLSTVLLIPTRKMAKSPVWGCLVTSGCSSALSLLSALRLCLTFFGTCLANIHTQPGNSSELSALAESSTTKEPKLMDKHFS